MRTSLSRHSLHPDQYESVTPCKICGSQSTLDGVVDFNKNCEEPRGTHLEFSGIPVYYHRCTRCGAMFTRAFDHWDHKTFRQYIYNEEYIQVDPAYSTIRPQKDVGMVHQLIAGARHVRILDYGGGTGVCAQILAGQGYQADSWDPITDMDSDGLYNSRSIPAAASYDLVTAFEVFEHSPHPAETIREATSFLRQDGVLFFSTCAIDALPPRTVGFWYIAPRNGHVTIYTTASLRHILSTNGYRMHSFHTNWHIAFRTVPHWLRHLFPGT